MVRKNGDKMKTVGCKKQDLPPYALMRYAKGGSSLVAENIQILCTRHNLEKRDKIE